MGLSGRKTKQRIPNDPRNLSWADDAARFGSNYLAKFGWDCSKGLGASGDGMTSHLKVSHKLDMLGIGAGHQRDPNGIAWKQNKDFENLLKRLNAEGAVEGFKKVEEVIEDDCQGGEKEKKRKKKKKSEVGDGPKKKKGKKEDSGLVESSIPIAPVTGASKSTSSVPRYRAHRARAIAAKNLSSKSASQISEVLGIAPTPPSFSSSNLPSVFPSGTNTPDGSSSTTSDTNTLEIEKITTSSRSVADYLKEKLKAKCSESAVSTPPNKENVDDYGDTPYYAPRSGLGSLSWMKTKDFNGLIKDEIRSSRSHDLEVAEEKHKSKSKREKGRTR